MSWYALSLVAGFTMAACIMADDKRALAWVLALAASFLVSWGWWKLSLPHHPAVAGLVDIGVALSVYFLGRHHWETVLFRILQFSVLINLIAHFGYINSVELHGTLLEVCNWAALALITGPKILNWLGYVGGDGSALADRLRGIGAALSAPRKARPFHQVWHI